MKTNQMSAAQVVVEIKQGQIAFPEQQPIIENRNGVPMASSLEVARFFGKEHKDVLKVIKQLDCSGDFQERNFAPLFYITKLPNGGSKKNPMYYMTKDGFTFLVMGFTGKTAAKFKEDYINAFNAMERKLKEGAVPKSEYNAAIRNRDKQIKELRDCIQYNAYRRIDELIKQRQRHSDSVRPKELYKLTNEQCLALEESFRLWFECENTDKYSAQTRDEKLLARLQAARLLYQSSTTSPVPVSLSFGYCPKL